MSFCNPFSFTLHTLLQPFLCIGCGGLQYRPLCGFCADLWVPYAEGQKEILSDCAYYPLWLGNTVTYRTFRQWKLTGASRLCEQLFQLQPEMREVLRSEGFGGVVPIPQDPRRSWRRGFESATEVAEFFGRELNLPVLKVLELDPTIEDQNRANRDRIGRMLSPNPFRMDPRWVLPAKLLVVDDVVTSGSTMEQALQTLRERSDLKSVAAASLVYKPNPDRGQNRRSRLGQTPVPRCQTGAQSLRVHE